MAWYQAKRNCRDCGEEQKVTIIGMAEYVDAAKLQDIVCANCRKATNVFSVEFGTRPSAPPPPPDTEPPAEPA